MRRMKVLCRVLVLGGVTAADVAAGEAESQMNPAVAHLETLFATAGGRLYLPDLVEVRASCWHFVLHGVDSMSANHWPLQVS